MSAVRRGPSGRQRTTSIMMTTPRSDSSAAARASTSTGTTTASSAQPSSRSRKKRKHRSSLELVGGGGDIAASSPLSGKEGNGNSNRKGSKRKRKLWSKSTLVASGRTPVLTQSQESERQRRQISPRSKSKLAGLVNEINPELLEPKDEPKKPSGNGKAKKNSVRPRYYENPTKNSAKKSKGGDDCNHEDNKSTVSDVVGPRGNQNLKNKKSTASSTSHLTPKTDMATIQPKGQSPEISYSPLDYRPQKNGNGSTDQMNDTPTPVLKSYVDQWTKPSPTNNNDGRLDDGKLNYRQNNTGEGEKSEERSISSAEKEDDEIHELDDPSSSVVSTSSNSDNDYDDVGGGYHDGVIDQRNQLVFKNKRYDKHRRHDDQLPNHDNIQPSPLLRSSKELEVEYGHLAFLKQQLERKMQIHKMDGDKLKQLAFGQSSHMDSNVGQHPLQLENGLNSDGMPLPWEDTRNKLELEYGRLASLKQELEQKMRMQKMDAEKINPWASNSTAFEVGAGAISSTLGGVDTGGTSAFASENNLSIHQSAKPDGGPSREAVAYGEMAYQHMMEARRMAQLKDDRQEYHEGSDEQTDKFRHEPHGRARKYLRDEYYPVQESVDLGNKSSRPSSRSKPKKKRKRKVVETITRVIHEESEEEGSSSTGGQRHNHNYYEPRNQKVGQFSHSKRYRGDNDEDQSFRATGSRSRQSDYNIQNRGVSNVSHRRQRDYPSYEHGYEDSSHSEIEVYRGDPRNDRRSRFSTKKRGINHDPESYTKHVASSRKNQKINKERRPVRGEGLNGRGRFHTHQSSTLESLH